VTMSSLLLVNVTMSSLLLVNVTMKLPCKAIKILA
jgi:hypothetical protein